MLLDTPSMMFLESSGDSGLSTSYTLLQATQLRLSRLQVVSRWLASSCPKGWLLASPLLRCLTCWGLRTEKPWHRNSIGKHLALQPAHYQSLTRPLYLAGFLLEASSKLWSSAGWLVWWMQTARQCLVSRNLIYRLRSTNTCQSLTEHLQMFLPGDVNVMEALVGQDLLAQVLR